MTAMETMTAAKASPAAESVTAAAVAATTATATAMNQDEWASCWTQ
jgi:hypothetical protein